MRSTIDLDDDLVREAFRYTGLSRKKDLVHLALQELIASRRRLDVRDLKGTGGLRPDYDPRNLRRKGE